MKPISPPVKELLDSIDTLISKGPITVAVQEHIVSTPSGDFDHTITYIRGNQTYTDTHTSPSAEPLASAMVEGLGQLIVDELGYTDVELQSEGTNGTVTIGSPTWAPQSPPRTRPVALYSHEVADLLGVSEAKVVRVNPGEGGHTEYSETMIYSTARKLGLPMGPVQDALTKHI
jgi:hypothetical protein